MRFGGTWLSKPGTDLAPKSTIGYDVIGVDVIGWDDLELGGMY